MENIEYKGYTIEISQDDDAENPRDPNYQDNIGKLLTVNKNYNIGEIDLYNRYPDAENWQDVEKEIQKEFNPIVMLPVYMYDHSGLRFKIGSFQGYLPQGHAEFDSGKIGYIIATKETIRENYQLKPGQRITKAIKEKAKGLLESEIETLDQWSCGDVYGYNIEETGDSCWGFYGQETAIQEAKESIDYEIEIQRQKKQKTLKTLIKNKVNLIYREAKLV